MLLIYARILTVTQVGLFGEFLRGRRANISKRCVNSESVTQVQ
jgi:hypothetical protein